jgi:replicative DNA helicase
MTGSTDLSDIGAERAILAAVLCDSRTIKSCGTLEPDDFSDPHLGAVYAAMLDIVESGRPVNPVTLKPVLDTLRMPDGETARDYFNANTVACLPPNVDAIAARVKDLSIRREVVKIATSARMDARDETRDVAATLSTLRRTVGNVSAAVNETSSGKVWFADHADDLAAALAGDGPLLAPTGIEALDARKGGLRPGELMILAGATSMGKSAVAHGIALNFALRHEGVLVISLEMPGRDVVARMVSDILARSYPSRVPYEAINRGIIPDDTKADFWAAMNYYRGLPIRIEDTPISDLSLLGVHAEAARKHFDERGLPLSLIVIDHIGLIRTRNAKHGLYAEMVEKSSTVASLARSLKVPVIALAQLNRQISQREGHWPQMSDLRDSGSLEQDADSVVFVHRPVYYLEKKLRDDDLGDMDEVDTRAEIAKAKNDLHLVMAKNRAGAVGDVKVYIEIEHNRVR